MIIDTHAHINELEYENLDEIIAKLKGYIIVNNGVDPETNKMVLKMADTYSNFYAAIGYHPEEVNKITDSDLELLEEELKNPKVVAIGEIGLDYHYRIDNKDKQKELFIKQLKLAKKYNKPVIVHSRDAISDTFDILNEYRVKADIHCFSSSLEMALKFIKIGCYIGVGGTVTFKNNKKAIEVVKNIDISKLLIETDSPYLAPEPKRGERNNSTNLIYVINKIAEIKNVSKEEVLEHLNQNAIDFFSLEGEDIDS